MLEDTQNIHLIGAGGIGISAIGKLLLSKNRRITGSDVVVSEQVEFLRKFGADIKLGHMQENMPDNTELVIYSPAVPEDNPERVKAKTLGVPQISYPEFLGKMSKNYKTVAVTGTHGKSTTTAMIGKILEDAGLDPTVIVGSKVPGWDYGNLRIGNSDLLVLEACEHHANMLQLHPYIGVITNMEEDHLDFYKDLAAIEKAFNQFRGQSKIVVGVGSPHPRRSGEPAPTLSIPGKFNQENARLALAVALELGVSEEKARVSLKEFSGIWRRFERVGKWHGAEIISDYAHHPTAVKGTLEAAREKFPKQRLVLCFQPHQHSRTKKLFNGFVESLAPADVLIIAEIYRVEGRLEDQTEISSRDLVQAIKEKNRNVFYAKDLDAAANKLREIIKEGDIVIVMGAGDIDEVARRFV